jgi:hypothetical protein
MRNTMKSGGLAGALALVLLAGAARGQTALGDGRGLEKDLRVGGDSGGLRPRANFMNEVRARNALVTGNAANGQSLQINSPYSAPDDFRGNLSTDDLFTFRRDSLGSTAGYYRGTQGLAYQNAFTTGLPHARTDIVTRLDTYGAGSELPRAGTTVRQASQPPHPRPPSVDSAAPKLEQQEVNPSPLSSSLSAQAAAPVGTLRSTGAFASTLNLTPAVVGFQESEQGAVERVTASSLLGVRVLEQKPKYTPAQLEQLTNRQLAEKPPETKPDAATGPDMSAQNQDLSARTPAFRTSYDDLKSRLTTIEQKPAESATPGQLPAGVHAPNEKAEPTAKPKEAEPTPEERLQRLRERLQEGKEKPKIEPGLKPGEKPGEKAAPQKPEVKPSGAGAGAKDKFPLAGLDDETLEIIRKAGGDTKSYTTGEATSLFEKHVRTGEEELAKGHYFDAEERFARALAMKPGDVTVQAARLNAQIGAGLYLSAATNLRQLFEQHPEVIGVHYKDATMPSAARISALMDEFHDNLIKARKDQMPVPEESALLLAYVGYQTGNADAVKEGLTALKKGPSGGIDQLIPVLEGVWLGKEK